MSLNDNDPLDDDFADFSDADSDGDGRGDSGSDGGFAGGSGDETTNGPIGAVPCIITITKVSRTTSWRSLLRAETLQPRKGALLVRALAADGKFTVDNLTHTNDVNIATSTSVEADFAREKMYIAPQVCTHGLRLGKSTYIVKFADLPHDLQIEFMKTFQARGIDDELARFLVEYVKRKEKLVSSLSPYKQFPH